MHEGAAKNLPSPNLRVGEYMFNDHSLTLSRMISVTQGTTW